jgi:hypothetical protein
MLHHFQAFVIFSPYPSFPKSFTKNDPRLTTKMEQEDQKQDTRPKAIVALFEMLSMTPPPDPVQFEIFCSLVHCQRLYILIGILLKSAIQEDATFGAFDRMYQVYREAERAWPRLGQEWLYGWSIHNDPLVQCYIYRKLHRPERTRKTLRKFRRQLLELTSTQITEDNWKEWFDVHWLHVPFSARLTNLFA